MPIPVSLTEKRTLMWSAGNSLSLDITSTQMVILPMVVNFRELLSKFPKTCRKRILSEIIQEGRLGSSSEVNSKFLASACIEKTPDISSINSFNSTGFSSIIISSASIFAKSKTSLTMPNNDVPDI